MFLETPAMHHFTNFVALACLLISSSPGRTDLKSVLPQRIEPQTYQVGVAKIDITPSYPIRLSGFGFRRTESEGVTQRIWAKAIAIEGGGGPRGDDPRSPVILITVENLGVPA